MTEEQNGQVPNDPSVVDGFLLSQDLMFVSKVTGTAMALGLRIEAIGTIGSLLERLKGTHPRALFLDLNCPEFEPHAVIAPLPLQPRPIVIAFGSHVDTVRLELAKSAGCDEVLPRSKFSATLPELLRRTLQVTP